MVIVTVHPIVWFHFGRSFFDDLEYHKSASKFIGSCKIERHLLLLTSMIAMRSYLKMMCFDSRLKSKAGMLRFPFGRKVDWTLTKSFLYSRDDVALWLEKQRGIVEVLLHGKYRKLKIWSNKVQLSTSNIPI